MRQKSSTSQISCTYEERWGGGVQMNHKKMQKVEWLPITITSQQTHMLSHFSCTNPSVTNPVFRCLLDHSEESGVSISLYHLGELNTRDADHFNAVFKAEDFVFVLKQEDQTARGVNVLEIHQERVFRVNCL